MYIPLQVKRSQSAGFTLIEISIVLVVIGLLVGGILSGRDLVRSAELRATISQIEKYNTSVNTFRSKYGGLPGDINNPGQFGLFSSGMNGSGGLGDGNGFIQDTYLGTLGGPRLNGEVLVFWRHLSDANMIDGSFGAGLISGGTVSTNQVNSLTYLWLPSAKIGKQSFFTVYSLQGFNFYQLHTTLSGDSYFSVQTTGGYAGSIGSVTPIEAYNIDKKTDDGLPLSGNIQAIKIGAGVFYGTPSTPGDGCSLAGTPITFDTGTTNASMLNCALSFKFQ